MTPREKQDLVLLFLRGQGVKDLAIFYACSQQTVQRLLREAIQQLANLNSKVGLRAREAEAALAQSADVEQEPA